MFIEQNSVLMMQYFFHVEVNFRVPSQRSLTYGVFKILHIIVSAATVAGRGQLNLADHELPDLHINNEDFNGDLWDAMSNTSGNLLDNAQHTNVIGTASEGEGNGNSETDSVTSLPRFDVGQIRQNLSEDEDNLFSDENNESDNDATLDEGMDEPGTETVSAKEPLKEENADHQEKATADLETGVNQKKNCPVASTKRLGGRKHGPVAVVTGKRRTRRTRGKKPSRFDSQFLMA